MIRNKTDYREEMNGRRNTYFNFESRISRDGFEKSRIDYGYGIFKCEWDYELVSADGAHYHVWIPRHFNKTQKEKYWKDFKEAANAKGDPVYFSWDYLPEGFEYEE